MIIYKLRDPDRAPALASHFENLFQHGAQSWQEREEGNLQIFSTLRISAAITVSLIILLAGFGIFNVLTMSVLSKVREIAILRSMGYRRIDISAIFLWQGALIAGVGSLLGCILGALLTWGISHVRSASAVCFTPTTFGCLGLATLFLGDRARDRRRLHRQLRAGAPGGATSAGGHFARVESMNGGLSLSCRDIERYLGEEESRVHALRAFRSMLNPGAFTPSSAFGCGKSTLLYILGLLDEPNAGSVEIAATSISHLKDEELARTRNELIGFIFQFHFLMEDFTAQENVMIPMRRLGQMNETEMRERAAALLEAVDLGDKLRRLSRHLFRRRATARGDARAPGERSSCHSRRRADRKSRHWQFATRIRVIGEPGS